MTDERLEQPPAGIVLEHDPQSSGSSRALTVPELPEDAIIVLPVRNMVLFPEIALPITIGRRGSLSAANEAARREAPIGVLLQQDAAEDNPEPEDMYGVGTLAQVLKIITAPDGSQHLVCHGRQRFRVKQFLRGYPYMVAQVEMLREQQVTDLEIEAKQNYLRQMAVEALQLLPQAPAEMVHAIQQMESPGRLADMVAAYMDLEPAEKQKVLETLDLNDRLKRVSELLSYRLEVLRLTHEISQQTKESVDERQREFMLREQLKTIQKELGEDDHAELEELREAIAAAQMPEAVEKQALKELGRLERMPDASGEHSMLRTYIDWLVELPWSVLSEGQIDVAHARDVLDEDHYGLDKVKRRILEFLAVRKLAPDTKSPILCLVGPPGVGKTSLGKSIARATGREFVRVSLGGVHDESEVRGHRRTYVGALPGNIIQGLRRAGQRDCVFMLDELDKLGQSFQGDPASALLEVLDPHQNDSFRDNYLAVPFDLSRVIFIATANVPDNIPGPLRDRMEMIHLPGYTDDEKLEIAKRYLVKRQVESSGLTPGQCKFSDAALRAIIRDYTREAGCRNLEREIGAVCRRVAMQVAEGEVKRRRISAKDLVEILGPRKFESESALRTSVPGVATGLAWTPVGGDVLFIEATRSSGSGKLILTGQLGDVMKESAQAALSLIKSRAETLGIDVAVFEKTDIHVHVPAGAIPKDGPSAGVAMFVALTSLLTGRKVAKDVAMTGEISLRGLVLPVGGIKEKVLAAHRAGIKRVLLPARNRKEFEEIPREARDELEFYWLEQADDVLDLAMLPASRRGK